MEELKNFIVDNSTQIWTLLSVVIGGLVTYISTSATEKRKNKHQSQKENLENILVPYCTCLEQTTIAISEIYQTPTKFYNKEEFSKWIEDLKKPLEYLEAAKRLYLSKSVRQNLQQYKAITTNFENTLLNECTSSLIKYKSYIAKKLEPFPNLPQSMLITFSMNEATESKVKTSILTKQKITLLRNFTCIDFIQNDDPDNYRNTAISINDNIRNSWGAISYGVMDISDVSPEEELACILLDYIEENITNEEETLTAIIDETQCAEALIIMREKLDEMIKELFKIMDKITN